MVCSISQGTSLTPPFNLVFFPQRQAAWVPRHAISATKGLAWGPHDTATTLEKTKKTMGSVRFGWGQYPKKLRESESGKKKNGADRFFDWNPSELHVQGSQWLQVFPYFGGRLFPKRTFPITNISPPETNSDEKKSTCPFEVRPENSGAL